MFQTANLRNWVPTDGDTFMTKENFVFNVFGYEHPNNRVFSFLKYVPSKFRVLFHVRFLQRTWNYGKLEFSRAEKLYTSENYQSFLETLRNNFPQYVHFCPFREKEVISAPLNRIKQVYVPRERLVSLRKTKRKDSLQKAILNLIKLLSVESGIPIEDFGVHGSIALNIHTSQSDLDFVVYGSQNFRTLEKTIDKLVEEKKLSYLVSNKLDAARRYKGRYLNKIFMYNAVRSAEEIYQKYGSRKCLPIKPIKFHCTVRDDCEAMFRPAIYKIDDYVPADSSSKLTKDQIPELVVSMIGCYRNIARQGSRIRVSGTLEQVRTIETGEASNQVVVGTGFEEDEYVWPL